MQPSFLKAKLLLDHPEWLLAFRADVGLASLDQVLQSTVPCVRQGAAFASSHGHPQFRCFDSHLSSFCNILVTPVAVNNLLIAMQYLGV